MDEREITKYLYQILDGGFRCEYGGSTYRFEQPPPQQLYIAETIYDNTFKRAVFLDIPTEQQQLDIYIKKSLYERDSDRELNKTIELLDNLKLQLYDTFSAFKPLDKIRQSIVGIRDKIEVLLTKKQSLIMYSAESIARFARNQYVACVGCEVDPFRCDGALSMSLCNEYINSILDDNIIRGIARCDLWQRMWGASKDSTQLFGLPTYKLCQSQLSLLSWSNSYDRIRDSAEPPPEAVINDDDLLDGWLIWQHKRHKEEQKQKQQEKFSGHGEVFIPVSTVDEAARINDLNTSPAKSTKQQRMRVIQKLGTVKEEDLPDSKLKIRMQAQQQLMK